MKASDLFVGQSMIQIPWRFLNLVSAAVRERPASRVVVRVQPVCFYLWRTLIAITNLTITEWEELAESPGNWRLETAF